MTKKKVVTSFLTFSNITKIFTYYQKRREKGKKDCIINFSNIKGKKFKKTNYNKKKRREQNNPLSKQSKTKQSKKGRLFLIGIENPFN